MADLLIALSGEAAATLIAATHDERLIRRIDRTLRLENGRLTA